MIILYIPFYDEPNLQRRNELEECLAANLANPLINKIVLIADETISEVNTCFSKLIVHKLNKRCTFKDIIYDIVPIYSDDSTINIISNSDIEFNSSLERLKFIDWSSQALSCSRWDKKNNAWEVYPTWDSQDFWVFKGKAKEGMDIDFYQGIPGSDNRITYELDKVGYWVFNPSKDIVGKHHHESGVRYYIKNGIPTSAIPAPYKLLHPTDMSILKVKPLKKIGLMSMTDSIALGMLDGLKEYGEVRFFDWGSFAPDGVIINRSAFEKEAIELSKWADVIVMKLQFNNIVNYSLAEKMAANCKLVHFTDDVRAEIPMSFIYIAELCTSVFTNQNDVDKMKAMGYDAKFINVGFNPNIYHPKGHKSTPPEIVFMANNHYDAKTQKHLFPKGKERQDLVMYLSETYGDRFGVYGKGWAGLEKGDLFNNPMEEAAIYRGAKIAINQSNFIRERYTSDRIVRAMGSGCFVISQHYPLIELDYYPINQFTNHEELKEQIDKVLENEEERCEKAKLGCDHVHKEFTWRKVLYNII